MYRRALEHVRPVCSDEAQKIPLEDIINNPNTVQTSSMPEIIPNESTPTSNPPVNPPDNSEHQSNPDDQSQSQDQPDFEPETGNQSHEPHDPAIETPVPRDTSDDDLVTTHLLCLEDEVMPIDRMRSLALGGVNSKCPAGLIPKNVQLGPLMILLIATTDKKQRTEVKLSMLTSEEQKAFAQAKESEVQNWLKTGTVSRILRTKLAPEQILRCRWILTWKPRDEPSSDHATKSSKLQSHKPKHVWLY